MIMKVLLIGGTGRLSLDTTLLCIDRGYDVYLFNRGSNNSTLPTKVHSIIGNINDVETAKTALKDFEFDVVIDYLTYNVETLKKRIDTFDHKTKQYVFISSATVFAPRGEDITEESPIGNDRWAYCRQKLECERYLAVNRGQFSFAYTIVRPYVTYDRKRIPFPIISKKSCWNLLYRVEKGLPILMCGDGEQSVTLTNTRDFAVGIVGLLGNEAAYFNDYNIVGDENYTWNQVIREMEAFTGKTANVVHVPMDRIPRLVPSFEQEVLYDKGLTHSFSNDKIKREVPDFRTTISIHDGMMETLDYLKRTEKEHRYDAHWNSMENIVSWKMGYRAVRPSLRDRWNYFLGESRVIRRIKKILK